MSSFKINIRGKAKLNVCIKTNTSNIIDYIMPVSEKGCFII
jgi:hypothetical protein